MKKTIYIFSDGELVRKDHTLCYKNEETNRYIPVEDTGEIMLFGEVIFNKRLLELLSRKGIMLHYFNYYGNYVGSFYPLEHLNSGYMVLKQADSYLDDLKRREIAKEIVKGAGRNIRQVLKYYNSRGKGVKLNQQAIEDLIPAIDSCSHINELLGLEGNIRELYYQAFDAIINNDNFVFKKRSRRPPKNHLNAMISFGNTLLYAICLTEIYNTHLDPRIGFLHTTNFRSFSLNLDISEIFKPIIIDRIIFTLISKKMITVKDFEKRDNGYFLGDKAKKVFIREMDEKLKTTINHRETNRIVSYRRLIRLEAYKLEKHLMGVKPYTSYVAKW